MIQAAGLMIIGVYLIWMERHSHCHFYPSQRHVHIHTHDDGHHPHHHPEIAREPHAYEHSIMIWSIFMPIGQTPIIDTNIDFT